VCVCVCVGATCVSPDSSCGTTRLVSYSSKSQCHHSLPTHTHSTLTTPTQARAIQSIRSRFQASKRLSPAASMLGVFHVYRARVCPEVEQRARRTVRRVTVMIPQHPTTSGSTSLTPTLSLDAQPSNTRPVTSGTRDEGRFGQRRSSSSILTMLVTHCCSPHAHAPPPLFLENDFAEWAVCGGGWVGGCSDVADTDRSPCSPTNGRSSPTPATQFLCTCTCPYSYHPCSSTTSRFGAG
jgi:hypothetical protein